MKRHAKAEPVREYFSIGDVWRSPSSSLTCCAIGRANSSS